MSEHNNDITETISYLLTIVTAIAAATGVVLLIIWGINSIGSWYNSTVNSPEAKAAQEKADAEWKTSPKNPEVAGQKCLDSGGYPKYSAWDGRFLECKK